MFEQPFMMAWDSINRTTPVDFEDDYTDSGRWTQVGTGVTVDSGLADHVAFLTATEGTDRRVHQALGFTMSDTFVADFEFNPVDMTTTDARLWCLLAFTSTTDSFTTTSPPDMNYVNVIINGTTSTISVGLGSWDGGSSVGSSDKSVNISENTLCYLRMIRDSSSQIRLLLYSDSARTSLIDTITRTSITGVDSLQYVQHGVLKVSSGNCVSVNGTNLSVWDGVTSPP